jgi:hypothetical protein
MPNLPLSTIFLRQFRDGQMVFTMPNELRFQSLNYRQFTGTRNELNLLYNRLSLKLNDETLVQKLSDKLTNEVIPQTRHLSGYVSQLRKICLGNAKLEPYTLPYYSPLLCELKEFASLIEQFQKLLPTRILSFLNTIRKEKHTAYINKVSETEVISGLRDLTIHYLNLFEEPRDHFYCFLQSESPQEHAIMVYSRIGGSIMHLLDIIENLTISIRDTLSLLDKWETRLDRRERQEIYN